MSCCLPFLVWYTAFSSADHLRVAAACLARSLASTGFAPPLVGKSRMWPILDFTIKSLPRYLLIVFALAGDSTITKDLPISICVSQRCSGCQHPTVTALDASDN